MNTLAFANPWLLAALLAVGLPILIHYLTRARPQRIRFPTFELLREAAAGQQSLHRLRTWLLLAIRTLAVLAIVLWFARPFLRQADAQVADASKRVVVILDASLSMRAVSPQHVTLFAQAQSEAAAVLEGLPGDSSAAVVLIGAQPRALLPTLTKNRDALHDEMIRARATYESGDPAAALALARRLLGGAGTIYIFSDFQRTNWEGIHFNDLPGVLVKLRSVESQPPDNVAVTAVKVNGETIIATILNASPRLREETVRCELDTAKQEARVSLPPYSSQDVTFNAEAAVDGNQLGQVMLTTADDLMEDNVRYFHLHGQRNQHVLLLSDAEPRDHHSTAFYLAAALAAGPRVKLERRLTQDVDRHVLESADVFVLAAPATLTGETADLILQRVREGAHLICWFDGPSAPALVGSLAGLEPPLRVGRVATAEASLTMDDVTKGPLHAFADPQQAEFSALRFHRHYQTDLAGGHDAEVLLRFDDGAVALAQHPVGKGATMWANLPVTPESSEFAGSPLFPAMLHEMLHLLNDARDEQSIVPGMSWQIAVANSAAGPLTVMGPDQREVTAAVIPIGLTLPPAELPGHYLVKRGHEIVAVGVVNVDARESDVRPMAMPEVVQSASNSVAVINDLDGLSPSQPSQPLWPKLAECAAGLLMLEMILLVFWPTRSSRR